MIEPSPIGTNGDRDSRGRFAPGCPGGPGNPHAKQVAALRSALLEAVTPEDVAAIIAKLIAQAKDGDLPSAREVLSRALGPPIPADLLERLERLETLLGSPDGQGVP